MARLFVALDLDAHARDRLAQEQRRFAERLRPGSLRWVEPAHLHLTLVFIGEANHDMVQSLASVMGHHIDLPAFTVTFGTFGVFPSRGAPRALWVGVTAGLAEMVQLHEVVARRLEHAGIAREARPFTPHLTLARWRTSRPSDRPRDFGQPGDDITSVRVNDVTLFESRRSPKGPTYLALAHARLSPALH